MAMIGQNRPLIWPEVISIQVHAIAGHKRNWREHGRVTARICWFNPSPFGNGAMSTYAARHCYRQWRHHTSRHHSVSICQLSEESEWNGKIERPRVKNQSSRIDILDVLQWLVVFAPNQWQSTMKSVDATDKDGGGFSSFVMQGASITSTSFKKAQVLPVMIRCFWQTDYTAVMGQYLPVLKIESGLGDVWQGTFCSAKRRAQANNNQRGNFQHYARKCWYNHLYRCLILKGEQNEF